MKFIHLSDLHIGKRVNEFSMINDQKYILEQILNIIANEEINAVIVSGDVYDKSIPAVEAVTYGACRKRYTDINNKRQPRFAGKIGVRK